MLVIIGLIVLYAATYGEETGLPHLFKKQLLWAAIGTLLLIIAMVISPRIHFAFAYLLYILSCLFLLGVLIWGDPTKGAARWIGFGGITFQPSEPAKIALILALARSVTEKKYNPRKASHLLRTTVMAGLPLALVMAQPDLGTSIIFATVFLYIVVVSGTPYSYLLVIISPILAALASFNVITMIVFLALFLLTAWRLKFRFGLLIFLVVNYHQEHSFSW